ncbi:hypothetical protein [Sinomicrobium sp. M5D2P9]
MGEWYNSLMLTEQIFWGIAIISTVIFLIIMVLTFVGGEGDFGSSEISVDSEIEYDHGVGFQFFTLKNLIAFFTIFGWSGITCLNAGFSFPLTIVVSSFCGLLMMFIMAALFYYISRLTQSGTLQYKNALNVIGEVYLEIGKNRSRMGKVQVKVQGALREMEALTDAEVNLPQGTVIRVEAVTNNGILIVNPVSE